MSRLRDAHNQIWEALRDKRAALEVEVKKPFVPVPRDRYKNQWERDFAEYQDGRLKRGEIWKYAYQGLVFPIAEDAHYTPDFDCWLPDDVIEIFEVKGRKREAAIVRFRVARSMYPQFNWHMVDKRGKHWKEVKV